MIQFLSAPGRGPTPETECEEAGEPVRRPYDLGRGRRRAWTVLLLVALVATVCAGAAGGMWGRLVSGGFDASGSQAVRADAYVASRFGGGEPQLALLVHSGAPVDSPAAVAAGRELAAGLARDPGVVSVISYWDGRDPLLRSAGGDSALVLAVLAGGEDQRVRTARRLLPPLVGDNGDNGGPRVEATGPAWVGAEAVERSQRDLLRAELLTAPLVFLLLVFAFRSVLAALLPVLVAAVSSVITLALLRPLASVVELSMFAPNLTTALGFGLAIDYCLFLLTRFRRERAGGLDVAAAVDVAVRTAGRTVVFSVVTVALVMGCLFAFPVPFLRSMAWAGIAVAVSSGVVVVLVMPAVLLLAGERLSRSGPPVGRSRDGRAGDSAGWEASAGWRRFAALVCGRPALWLVAALALLSVMSLPLARLQVAPIDERTLPSHASSHMGADRIGGELPQQSPGTMVVVALPAAAEHVTEVGAYAATLSRLPAAQVVDSAAGRYENGHRIAPAPMAFPPGRAGTWLAVHAGVDPATPAAGALVSALRAVPAPGGTAWVGGEAARFTDTTNALLSAAGPAVAWAVACMALLLLLFTRSLLVPVKAIVVGALSLGASAGVVVLVFQDGFLAGLVGMTSRTGPVDACMLLLALCVAFALSMDYETFLLARIQEEHLLGVGNRAAVERGVEQTGRLVTTAALALAVSVGALTTSSVGLLKILGFALALAALVDATVVRAVLVPASMCLAGKANWWAPAPLRRLLPHWDLHGAAHPNRGSDTATATALPSPRVLR
ncbi:MMPL family transporter [Streptomyces sp. NPDC057137]|uniref:MMPL family transporter n=1 Tax=Streptomyces sp. NPDC057137 TaxID=3346030 RepID=UPI00363484FD